MKPMGVLTVQPAPPVPAYRIHHGRRRRAVTLAGFTLTGTVLFGVFWLQSTRGTFVNSDGASNALQAWDMLHGNVLLHGWAVSDVSFYTTELPEYALVEIFRGLNAGVVHVCGALTYALLVLLAGTLAMGRDGAGRYGTERAAVAIAIMLAPEPGNATRALLLSPDHVGTGVPLLLLWLLIDRGTRPGRGARSGRGAQLDRGAQLERGTRPGPRWITPVAAGLLLAWMSVGDTLAWIIGALPLALVCLFRAVRKRGHGWGACRDELSLAAAAALSVPAAMLVTRMITAFGGWTVSSPQSGLAGPALWPQHLYLTGLGILQLFGADVTAQPTGIGLFFAVLHLAGLALAAAALGAALVKFSRQDLIVQVLTLAIVINLAAYMFTRVAWNINDTREIAAVLPFGAVLAGRLFPVPRTRSRGVVRPGPVVAGVLLAAYSAMLGYNATRPPVPAPPAGLTAWLAGHHLTRGLGSYWQANAVTLDSQGAVQVRAIDVAADRPVAGSFWEASSSWYDPAKQYADFVVTPQRSARIAAPLIAAMEAVAGRPAKTYFYDGLGVAVWRQNLLTTLGKVAAWK
jgi:hypothetical protein